MAKSSITERPVAPNLCELLLGAAERFPDRDALVFPDFALTYAALRERALERARSMVALGVEPGDHVGILMPNCPEYIELLLGAILAGAVAVPVNARYKAAELAYVVENADLVGLITSDLASEYVDFAGLLAESFPELAAADSPGALSIERVPRLRFVTSISAETPPGFVAYSAFRAAVDETPESSVNARIAGVTGAEAAIMMYTSGTTANPKGCPLGHAALAHKRCRHESAALLSRPGGPSMGAVAHVPHGLHSAALGLL